jgi:hypothetical protein
MKALREEGSLGPYWKRQREAHAHGHGHEGAEAHH